LQDEVKSYKNKAKLYENILIENGALKSENKRLKKIVSKLENQVQEMSDQKALYAELEKYICIESRVPIVDLFNSAQAILPNGDTYFFNDVGNVLLWLARQKNKEKIVVWVYAQDTERYVLAKDAWYSRVEITPMGYGFGAYEFRLYGTSDYYFNEVQRFALRGETLLHPMVNALLTHNKL